MRRATSFDLIAPDRNSLGPGVYEKEGYFPWKAPIEGPFYRGSQVK